MPSSRISLNRRGIRELLRSKPVERDMGDRASHVADQGRTIAPRVTGTYIDHIDSWTEVNSSRAVGRAGSDVEYATQVEAKHRVFGRAIDAARG